jgi:hypothetical protein
MSESNSPVLKYNIPAGLRTPDETQTVGANDAAEAVCVAAELRVNHQAYVNSCRQDLRFKRGDMERAQRDLEEAIAKADLAEAWFREMVKEAAK